MRDPARILVVDDVADNVEILRMRLSALGYDVDEANDGEQALAKVAAEIAGSDSNIDNVTVAPDSGDQYATMNFTLQVANRVHLAKIMRSLRSIPEVARITRVNSTSNAAPGSSAPRRDH